MGQAIVLLDATSTVAAREEPIMSLISATQHMFNLTGPPESVPTIWDEARDMPFFRCTADLFPQTFTLGASVLLASYDDAGSS